MDPIPNVLNRMRKGTLSVFVTPRLYLSVTGTNLVTKVGWLKMSPNVLSRVELLKTIIAKVMATDNIAENQYVYFFIKYDDKELKILFLYTRDEYYIDIF